MQVGDANSICSICKEIVHSEEPNRPVKACGHVFHASCDVKGSLGIQDCFDCREPIDSNSLPSLKERLIWAYSKGYDFGFANSPEMMPRVMAIPNIGVAVCCGIFAGYDALSKSGEFSDFVDLLIRGLLFPGALSSASVILAGVEQNKGFLKPIVIAGLCPIVAGLIGGSPTGWAVCAGTAFASAFVKALTTNDIISSRIGCSLTGGVIGAGLSAGLASAAIGIPSSFFISTITGIGTPIFHTFLAESLPNNRWTSYALQISSPLIIARTVAKVMGADMYSVGIAAALGSLSGSHAGVFNSLYCDPDNEGRQLVRLIGKHRPVRRMMGGVCAAGALTAQCLREVGRGARAVGQRLSEINGRSPLTVAASVGLAAFATGALLYAGL